MATIGAAISGRAKGKEYNMGLFNQRKDTVEWIEYRPDLLFYKWKDREIKKGSHLIIRAGQKAIFYSGGRIHGIFEMRATMISIPRSFRSSPISARRCTCAAIPASVPRSISSTART